MRWTTPKTPVVRVGDYRKRRTFLLWPLTLNEETRWLETVTVEEVAEKRLVTGQLVIGPVFYDIEWRPVAFIDTRK